MERAWCGSSGLRIVVDSREDLAVYTQRWKMDGAMERLGGINSGSAPGVPLEPSDRPGHGVVSATLRPGQIYVLQIQLRNNDEVKAQ